MELFTKIIVVLGMAGIGWWIYHSIRSNPQAFSKENLGKSFYTMGILAIGLIAIIMLCIWILRSGA